MALTKKVYVDNQTVIPAANLNAIQDEVIANATAIEGKAPVQHTHTKSQITDFPTSMPASDVSDWAKASKKPTYTASEVGAAPTSHTHTKSQITDLTDYSLPKATKTVLGGVKVGEGLSITTDGTLSANVVSGEPDEYLKSASISGNELTLVKKDNTTITFIPTTSGGGSAEKVDWANVYNKPTTFTPSAHTHTKSEITDLTDYSLPIASATVLGGVKIGSGLSITNGVLSVNEGSKTVDWSDVENKPTTFAPSAHTHDDRYYTESEVDTKLAAKAGTSVATTSAAGLMSAADKTKLNNLSQTSITVDSALSTTSTNPAQNKVITVALNNKAPQYQYSTTDLTPNVSSLDTGKMYVVYE